MRRGVTLIELLVTISIIGIVSAVVTLAIGPSRPLPDDAAARIASARHRAVVTGRDTTIAATDSIEATAHPDGSVVTDTSVHVERLTGAVDARR